jgi:hypothetical protein
MTNFKSSYENVYAKEIPYTQEQLNERFTYKNGKLYHKNYRDRIRAGRNYEGLEAGVFNSFNRCIIQLNYTKYLRSRLIYKMLNGNDPVGVLDHIDNDCTNDKIENLQDVTQHYNRWGKK